MDVNRPDLRVGDAKRDDATLLLRDHLAAGRLDEQEFELRIHHALQATRQSDLSEIFADLPGRRPGQPLPVPRMPATPPAHTAPPAWLWPAGVAALVGMFWGVLLGARDGRPQGMPAGMHHMHEHSSTITHLAMFFAAVPIVLGLVAVGFTVGWIIMQRARRRRAA